MPRARRADLVVHHLEHTVRAGTGCLLVSDYAPRFGPAMVEMAGWIREGTLKYREDIVEGFENMVKAFVGLFSGENTGKRLVKIA